MIVAVQRWTTVRPRDVRRCAADYIYFSLSLYIYLQAPHIMLLMPWGYWAPLQGFLTLDHFSVETHKVWGTPPGRKPPFVAIASAEDHGFFKPPLKDFARPCGMMYHERPSDPDLPKPYSTILNITKNTKPCQTILN